MVCLRSADDFEGFYLAPCGVIGLAADPFVGADTDVIGRVLLQAGADGAGVLVAVQMCIRDRVDPDSFDYGFYAYGLELYGNIPLMEPLEYQETRKIHDLVIVIDTSDSCREGVIAAFLSETRAILNQSDLFFQNANLHIIQNDAAVQVDVYKRQGLSAVPEIGALRPVPQPDRTARRWFRLNRCV